MTFSGRYLARNGKLYEVIEKLPDGRHVGALVLNEHSPMGNPLSWGPDRLFWDTLGNHHSERELDLMELERAGKRYR
jgi:hypothetical protein